MTHDETVLIALVRAAAKLAGRIPWLDHEARDLERILARLEGS